MRASTILLKLFAVCLHVIHVARFKALLAVVDAAVRSGDLRLTSLGRSLPSTTTAKHRIKRVDRLLGNVRLHGEAHLIYGQLAYLLLGRCKRPVLVLDWTQISEDKYALWAGVPYLGRAIPLYAEAHRIAKLTKRRIHGRFLRRLRALLPPESLPVIIADAEFCKPFFGDCLAAGFDYLVRLRGRALLRRYEGGESSTQTARDLARCASSKPTVVGMRWPYDSARKGSPANIIVARKPKSYRRKATNSYGKRAREAWVLATSLSDMSAQQFVNLYAKRMQIEEMFRDAKNARLGLLLGCARSENVDRLAVLLLLCTLVTFASLLIGLGYADTPCARGLQANTVRCRRVLSLVNIGLYLLREPPPDSRLTPLDLATLISPALYAVPDGATSIHLWRP
jgi:hypothetical protein